jgi:hypothetical protein
MLKSVLVCSAGAMIISGCGPATFTRVRMEYEPYSAADARQEKEGVIVELKHAKQYPPSFTATVQACDRYGRPVADSAGRPVMEQVSLARRGQYWEQMALTNHTDHVIRLNGVVIRLFDPGANQTEALSWDDLAAKMYGERPCASSQQAMQIFRANKIFDRNIEIVPGTTSTFWVAFNPPSMTMTGVWKFAIYEVPVKLDSAGRPVKTTHFDMRVVARQFEDTYSQSGGLERAKIVSSREISPTVASPTPATAVQPPAQSEAQPSGQTVQPQPVTPAAASKSTGAPVPERAPIPDFAPPRSAQESAASGATPSLTKDTIARAQARLKERGYDPGAIDGGMGPRTRAAVRQFQSAQGLKATGDLNLETLKALGF